MKNMKVARKLIISFLIVIVLAVLVGVVGFIGMMQINSGAAELYERQTVPLVDLALSREYFQRLRSEQRNLVMASGDSGWLNDIEAAITYQEGAFRGAMYDFGYTIIDPAVRAAYNEAMSGFDEYMRHMADILRASRAGTPQDTLIDMMRAATPSANIAGDGMAAMMDSRIAQAAVTYQENTTMFNVMIIIIAVALVVAIVAALVLAIYIARMISKPLINLTTFFDRAAKEGDLAFEESELAVIENVKQNKDELGMLSNAAYMFMHEINEEMAMLEQVAEGNLAIEPNVLSAKDVIGLALTKTVDSLNNMFNEVKSSTAQVATGSRQVADGSQSLAQGSTEQAASVQQLSSSIIEIAEKTKNNAEMAEKAALLANDIKGSAQKGSMQMDEMMTAVKDINVSSQNISKVIKSIEDIAFQTNILALNAAVEAARAGQHGKGFAVVAEEVRNLAAKSAEAAKDTESLISDSIEKAELGSRIADDTAASLTEIVAGIGESSALVSEIARSSEEQTVGIDQINKGIDQVAQVTQQNSATAEQSAAASQEMSSQSDMLEELIARFKLKDDRGNARKNLPSAAAVPAASSRPAEPLASKDDGGYGKY